MAIKAVVRVLRAAGFVVLSMVTAVAYAQEAPRITKEKTLTMMDRPEVVIVDVRLEDVRIGVDSKIRGAVRENPENVDSWMHKYPKDKTLIFYCS